MNWAANPGGTALSAGGAAVPEENVFNIVRQHTTFDENTVFWGPETSYNRDFLELLIFARILFHDVNTSRAITLRRIYGSSSYFAWCKILPISNEV